MSGVRGAPRFTRGAPNAWGVWGAIPGPPMWTVWEELLEEGAHLGAVPFSGAECHADGVAAGAHEERGRKSGHAPGLRGFEVGVEEHGEGQAEPAHVGIEQGPRSVAINGDAQDDQPAIPVLLPERLECRHLGETRLAPRRPEVHDHELVAMLRQRRH